ncbi:MAG: septum formation initiator family protein [Prevotellaceae bacterium]|nr:septum formation initiator family protein [Prevotellaceae bacterium]
MEKLSFYLRKLKNKYIIICIIFAVVMFGGICERISNAREIAKLESEIAKYKADTEKYQKEIDDLNANKKRIEELARDNGMKAEGEDVFVAE